MVSKEPPAPVDGTRDTGHDRGQKAGLSCNWVVPSVLVKDVPNFELLSPELETGTAPSFLHLLPWRVPCTWGLGAGTLPRDAHGLEEDRTLSEYLLSARCGATGLIHAVSLIPHDSCGPRCFSSPHFNDEETGAQRGKETRQGLRGYSWGIRTQACA